MELPPLLSGTPGMRGAELVACGATAASEVRQSRESAHARPLSASPTLGCKLPRRRRPPYLTRGGFGEGGARSLQRACEGCVTHLDRGRARRRDGLHCQRETLEASGRRHRAFTRTRRVNQTRAAERHHGTRPTLRSPGPHRNPHVPPPPSGRAPHKAGLRPPHARRRGRKYPRARAPQRCTERRDDAPIGRVGAPASLSAAGS